MRKLISAPYVLATVAIVLAIGAALYARPRLFLLGDALVRQPLLAIDARLAGLQEAIAARSDLTARIEALEARSQAPTEPSEPDATLSAANAGPEPEPEPLPRISTKQVVSALLNFDFTVFNQGEPIPGEGGGLGLHQTGVLIARDTSGIPYFMPAGSDQLVALDFKLPPTNYDSLPEVTEGGATINKSGHRYNDLLFVTRGGTDELFVSYSYLHADDNCVTSRISAAVLPAGWQALVADDQPIELDWSLRFESDPCLAFFTGARNAYAGHQAGGRMTLDGNDIVFTVGDYEFDGINGKLPVHPQDESTSYGKIFRMPVESGAASIVSLGHRNPQGVTIDGNGNIWSVEHSAMGGDELNLIGQGNNYGWPYATLGVAYADPSTDIRDWPYTEQSLVGRHLNYEPPVYAWIPSVAPNAIKYVSGLHPRWDGDLLVGTLARQTLQRLRISDGRVIYDEQIPLGRIRDFEVGDGRVFVLLDDGTFATLTPREPAEGPDTADTADVAPGRVSTPNSPLVAFRCMECHSQANMPSVFVYGERAASQSGVEYSEALRNSGLEWSREALISYLMDTQALVPGTKMPSLGLTMDSAEAVVDYLMDAEE